MTTESGTVAALTLEGHGIIAGEGRRVMVPGVLPGERITYSRRRRRRNYDEGSLVELVEEAPSRVRPRCPSFGICGGCSLQHLSAEGQLAEKQDALLQSLARLGGVSAERLLPPLSGSAWGYRRRARLAVRDVPKKGRVLVGFREQGRPYVADMNECHTLHPEIAALIPRLSELIGRLSIRARLPQVEATVADNAVALVFRVLSAPSSADLEHLRSFAMREELRLFLQPGGPDSLAALQGTADPDDLHYSLSAWNLELRFGPVDFIQVHAEINRMMIDQAMGLLEPGPTDRVLDLYCGIGNFTLPAARRAGEVLGLEGAGSAVRRAEANARMNGIANARFVEADLAGAGAEGAWTRERFDLALLDPPRSGAAPLLPALSCVGPRRIVYVSCHPGTLARDAGILVREHGYRLEAAGVMDMFPQTSHVESMALFTHDRNADGRRD